MLIEHNLLIINLLNYDVKTLTVLGFSVIFMW